ncbi:MAG TPA: cyanophycin synthetase, partial [Candidatus Saccharimonadales bacterium]|nr:cyanophycin synthetase [Candidatus Saccharimonadales bacterium]
KHWLHLAESGLKGEHNLLNGAIAAAVASIIGVTNDQIIEGLKAFEPLPHRLEKVTTVKGVLYVDDSYATTPESAMAALTAFDESAVWIGGGSTKGADFTELARAINESSVRAALLLGQEASKIAQALKKIAPRISVEICPSLSEVVARAGELARPGEVVLLSPACASKDMFTNAAERGQQFQDLVKKNANLQTP